MRRAVRLAVAALLVTPANGRADVGDYLNKPVAAVRLELEGREIADPELLQVVETHAGAPLSMVAVRETVARLFSLGRYEDVRVHASAAAGGVSLRYDLVPLHPVQRIAFAGAQGHAGIDVGALRRDVVERYGNSPSLGRAADLVRIVEDDLRNAGYLHPTVTPRADIQHSPDRTTLVFAIEPGARTHIGAVEVVGTSGLPERALLDRLGVSRGAPYQSAALEASIARYIEERRSKGYLEATLTPTIRLSDADRVANLTLSVDQGPLVRVVFSGDPLPAEGRNELVPVESEGSADEDLLEDSSNRIEEYLRSEGYRDAAAPYARQELAAELLITFSVKRGARYRVARVDVTGNAAVPPAALDPVLQTRVGQPFSEAKLDADASAIADLYRRLGFTAARVRTDLEMPPAEGPRADIPVIVQIAITENVRTIVSSVRIEGNASIPEAELQQNLGLRPGVPFFITQLAVDRDAIQLRYANLGFQSALVEGNPGLNADGSRADVVFTVTEGPRLFVDHILIVGNARTRTETIERELQFKPGDPLSLAAIAETQRRLSELGLFRRTEITAIGHGEQRRDLLVRLDEAPPTSIGYGAGIEAGERIRSTQAGGGVAEQHLELAPRAFFQIGRSNLFGKNRSVNLFTRLSLRPKDAQVFPDQTQTGEDGGRFGFAEYRILATFREPRLLGTTADAFLNGTLEQQVRSSFDFARRAFSAELGRRLSRDISASGNYQIQRIELFNERLTAINSSERLLIDRIFPEVRLSSFSGSLIRSTRNDALDPSAGDYLSAYVQVAARAIGSEVGLAKTYLTGQLFRTVPRAKGTVLAASARLGLAAGFERAVTVPGVDGASTTAVVKDLPASERFFAGGDSNRGFALDQLGTAETIDQDGFPIGGNALVIVQTELRVPYRNLQFVGFLDTGNVFARPTLIDLTQMRSAAGFGIRYRSPIGPIRVDLGFKLRRHDIVPGKREPLTALHISLGQAF
jgi:outer membrane protein assembly complex protein YaeT